MDILNQSSPALVFVLNCTNAAEAEYSIFLNQHAVFIPAWPVFHNHRRNMSGVYFWTDGKGELFFTSFNDPTRNMKSGLFINRFSLCFSTLDTKIPQNYIIKCLSRHKFGAFEDLKPDSLCEIWFISFCLFISGPEVKIPQLIRARPLHTLNS